jgi:hypothetical protein
MFHLINILLSILLAFLLMAPDMIILSCNIINWKKIIRNNQLYLGFIGLMMSLIAIVGMLGVGTL